MKEIAMRRNFMANGGNVDPDQVANPNIFDDVGVMIKKQKPVGDYGHYDLIGAGSRVCPLFVQEMLVNRMARHIAARHPSMISRLSDSEGKVYAFHVAELPFIITLCMKKGVPLIKLRERKNRPHAAVTLTATLKTFIDLFEGKSDGDALFFSRELVVEGDTEALLLLRNAIESDDIDLPREIFSMFGKYEGMAHKAFDVGATVFGLANQSVTKVEGVLPPQFGMARKKLGNIILRQING
jgi:predicted lipid carrier protein YhbT